MKMSLEHSAIVVRIDGCQTRLWKGTTGKGTAVVAAIARIGVPAGDAGELVCDFPEDGVHQQGDTRK